MGKWRISFGAAPAAALVASTTVSGEDVLQLAARAQVGEGDPQPRPASEIRVDAS